MVFMLAFAFAFELVPKSKFTFECKGPRDAGCRALLDMDEALNAGIPDTTD